VNAGIAFPKPVQATPTSVVFFSTLQQEIMSLYVGSVQAKTFVFYVAPCYLTSLCNKPAPYSDVIGTGMLCKANTYINSLTTPGIEPKISQFRPMTSYHCAFALLNGPKACWTGRSQELCNQ